MAVKLTRIELGGFRGARRRLDLSLPSQASLLLYGENGSGKSTFTDGMEWFYYDRVAHLASQEIGRNGIPALRNLELSDDEEAFVTVELSDAGLSATKTLSVKKARLVSEYSNSSPEFVDYREASTAERIILRYRDLLEFVLSTKADKLAEISQIIGFGEVRKTRATLKKAANELRRLEKAKEFDGSISRQQADIIDQLGQNVATEEQFVAAAQDLLAPLDLGLEVNDLASLDKAIALIKSPADDEIIQMEVSYGNVLGAVQALRDGREQCESAYLDYRKKHEALLKDAEKLASMEVEKLLAEGVSVLEGTWEQDACPLCLQARSRDDLVEELTRRRSDLSALRKEREALEEAKSTVVASLQELLVKVDFATRERCLSAEGSTEIKKAVGSVRVKLASAHEMVSTSRLLDSVELPVDLPGWDMSELEALASSVKAMKTATGKRRRSDDRFSVVAKLALAKRAYAEIASLRAQQGAVRGQLDSMDCIYREFVKRERDSLTRFLASISTDINDLYLFMNADDRIEGVRLIPVSREDEFVGVTFSMTFRGDAVSPPEKYLSESRINSLGICLFLASVKAYNKINRFFVLDDVISSFDEDHRLRFGQLLRERFSDYQILLFTHERNWFNLMSHLVKGSGWEIKQVAWDDKDGAVLKPAPEQPREAIEEKLLRSDTDGAGNLMRIHLERLLKQVCLSLKVKLQFLANERNEDRMSGELLSGLIGTLRRRKCEVRADPVVQRLLDSAFVANKSSHDGAYTPGLGDLRVVWKDIVEFEKLLVCQKCSELIGASNIGAAVGTITCKCGELKYSWRVK